MSWRFDMQCCNRSMDAHLQLDSALNELGMLSTSTNSRKEYIRERNRTTSEPSLTHYTGIYKTFEPSNESLIEMDSYSLSPPIDRPFNEPQPARPCNVGQPMSPGKGFQVLHANPQYVTAFTADPIPVNFPTLTQFSTNSNINIEPGFMSSSELNNTSLSINPYTPVPSSSFSSDYDMEQHSSRSNCTNRHMQNSPIPTYGSCTPVFDPKARDCDEDPYCCVNGGRKGKRIRMSRFRKDRYSHTRKPYDLPIRLNKSVPEVEMRFAEKFECKSTSSSPVKGVIVPQGPLTRSRSLSNLEAARTKLVDIFEETLDQENAVEIDNMSTRIENLQFAEKLEKL